MQCPKCNSEIDEKMLVCPSCKKVLKLVCPICNTINKSNLCKKCGFTIITKCHKCGKINQTIKEKCSKCGFNTYTSVAINTSEIDEFACITIDFPNIDSMKSALGSTKMFEKFKTTLDNRISDYAKSIDLVKEIIDGLYVLKFNKDFSFEVSAERALKAAIEIQTMVMELNFKLNKLKNASVQSNIAIFKRDINSSPKEFKSGFDIKLMNQTTKELRLLNNLQIIVDSDIYSVVCDKYSLSMLSSTHVRGKTVTFFELNLKKYIEIPQEQKPEDMTAAIPQMPKFLDDAYEEEEDNDGELYNIESINFEEIKCNFKSFKSAELINEIINAFKINKKSILSVKGDRNYAPRSADLIHSIENSEIFSQVYRVTCYEDMKYKPYAFFYELISSICSFSQSTKLLPQSDFSMFDTIDSLGLIKDLISFNKRTSPNSEEVRFTLFEIFFNLLYSLSNSLIYIEYIDKMDDTSYELLQTIFEKFEELDISLLATTEKEFALHRDFHYLLTNENYTEIVFTSTPFAELIGKNVAMYKEVLESYYGQKIAQCTKGSPLYFANVIDYLVENELIESNDNVFTVKSVRNILIPPSLEALMVKRLKTLLKDEDTYKILAMFLLMGPRIDVTLLSLLNIEKTEEKIQKLIDGNYIYLHNYSYYISNYNLLKNAFLKSVDADFKIILADELINCVFSADTVSPTEAILYEILELPDKEFKTWQKLAELSTSFGDFGAYLNCSIKFLNLANSYIDESSGKSLDDYKMEIFENISTLLYKYSPDKIQHVAHIIIENLEKSTDSVKAINLCYKMVQGCLISGDYSQAIKLIHKILSKIPHASFDPNNQNFNIAFFHIKMIQIEVLFSTGDLKECVELGDEILDALRSGNIQALKPENVSNKEFSDSIFDIMGFVALARILLMNHDFDSFVGKLQSVFGHIPESFELYYVLFSALRGTISPIEELNHNEDKIPKVIYYILKAFYQEDYKTFASDVYQAKLAAKAQKIYQLELICDLFIGYAYFTLREYKKASYIYDSVLNTSNEKGLKIVTYISWYLIAILNWELGELDIAFGLANNAVIRLEKDSGSSEYLLFLFKVILTRILITKKEYEQARIVLNHVIFIQDKYGLKINLGANLYAFLNGNIQEDLPENTENSEYSESTESLENMENMEDFENFEDVQQETSNEKE